MIGHYLLFNRNCAEAVETYAKAFDAKVIQMQRYRDMPPNPAFPVSEADKDLVLHGRLDINGEGLLCADSARTLEAGTNMYVSIFTPDAAVATKAWAVLKEGGEVYMELAPAFFADLHGSLRDRFGINWMFTVHK